MSARKHFLLEICANSYQSARNAEEGGADRIELCQQLDVGGITPSHGLIQMVEQDVGLPVHVLIRPRPGNFVYSDEEYYIMMADIQACVELGVEGVVIGMLDQEHRVDVPRVKQLVRIAGSMTVTFHRAFDDCGDKPGALEDVISTGCSRILTAGGSVGRAVDNVSDIAELVLQAHGRIQIVAGGGLHAAGVTVLAKTAGVREFHASATETKAQNKTVRRSAFDVEMKETKTETVRDLAQVVASLHQ